MYDVTFQARVWPIIISMLESYIMPVFNGRLYDSIPGSLATFPLGVYQSQDNTGKNDDTINTNGWTGLVTIRCIDTTISGAWSKALEVAALLPTMVYSGYSISAIAAKPIKFPVERLTQGSIYTAGLVISIGIYKQ